MADQNVAENKLYMIKRVYILFTESQNMLCNCSELSHIDGLVQDRCNSISNAFELRLSCTKPSISRKYFDV